MFRLFSCVIAALGILIGPVAAGWTLESASESAELPANAAFIESEVSRDGAAARLQGVRADSRQAEFVVIDNPIAGTGRLDEAMRAGGFFAGVNGGYFHPDFRPVGLEIADGEEIHPFERAKLLSGVFAVADDKPGLLRSPEFQNSSKITQALQAGPFLISNGSPTGGLNDTRRARRTVLATDGKTGWALLLVSPVTLAEAAEILAVPGIVPGLTISRALNLDGGSSSALWAATSPRPFYFREFTTVRNYVGLRAR